MVVLITADIGVRVDALLAELIGDGTAGISNTRVANCSMVA
jgi:hypothetical protein